ncbi:hypothetical protein BT96DRAFT_965626 [Gymnopus androsaceus JB14]|uniref:Uncharacterized protein n=1 Tax=Gymnopus androsaceus JB14 TaxID=1447944 RepID=A0A6A4HNX1_9AGAR|nr:hypothetical protein BT96DRAFT_965626 [Gymnopus androsaceus JB14]
MHGLTYNQSFLDSLPLVDELSPSNGSNPNPNLHSLFPKPHSPIHSLSAAQFASLHHQHILSHPPDSVLFPFLHGIEGDNEAQNMFFATQGQSVGVGSAAVGSGTVALPEYRGMMWVICEDDLDGAEKEFFKGLSRRRSESSLYSEEEEDESGSGCSDYDSEGEYEGERGGEDLDDEEEEDLDLDLDDGDGTSSDSEEPVSPVSLAPTTPQLMNGHAAPPHQDQIPPQTHERERHTKPHAPALPPPILTSTFRPHELLRRVPSTTKPTSGSGSRAPSKPNSNAHNDTDSDSSDDEWEFMPLRVPAGISLRNFGIQVPILASLSDIIVYSPTKDGANKSANARRWARRFKGAQERMRRKRAGNAGTAIKYNTFLLDATADEIRNEMPHLVVRLCREGDVPGSLRAAVLDTKGWIDGNEDEDGDVVMGTIPLSASPVPLSDSPPPGLDASTSTSPPPGHGCPLPPNTVDFAQREKDEMRDLTRASEIVSVFPTEDHEGIDLSTTATYFDPHVGQIFLGNAGDVPLPVDGFGELGDRVSAGPLSEGMWEEAYEAGTDKHANSPSFSAGYDICIECHDLAPFPTLGHIKASEDKWRFWRKGWKGIVQRDPARYEGAGAPRPPPHPNAIIHLPMPSSPPANAATMNALMPVVRFLKRCLMPVSASSTPEAMHKVDSVEVASEKKESSGDAERKSRRWSSVSSLMPSFPAFPMGMGMGAQTPTPAPASSTSRHRSMTTSDYSINTHASTSLPHSQCPPQHPPWSRPLKILLYSSDGYTESSVPALVLLMALKDLTLPEAYLELQVKKRRSFFVYQGDLGVLRRVEGVVGEERERERARARELGRQGERERRRRGESISEGDGRQGRAPASISGGGLFGFGTHMNPYLAWGPTTSSPTTEAPAQQQQQKTRPTAKSVSFAQAPFIPNPNLSSTIPLPLSLSTPVLGDPSPSNPTIATPSPSPSPTPSSSKAAPVRRPRASTSPWLPSLSGPGFGFGDHQSWFNDARFDGSFPSRVLPFLYLGNLAHASNVYMLQALGITHVVSVGECALVPPDHLSARGHGHYVASTHLYGHQAQRPPTHGHQGPHAPSHSHLYGHTHQHAHTGPGSLWIEERAGRIKVLDIQGICDDGIDTLEPQLEPICQWIDEARKEGGQVLVHCRVGVSRSATVVIAYVMKHLSLPLVDAYLIPNMRLLYNLLGWEVKLARERSALSWPFLAKEVHKLNEKYLR